GAAVVQCRFGRGEWVRAERRDLLHSGRAAEQDEELQGQCGGVAVAQPLDPGLPGGADQLPLQDRPAEAEGDLPGHAFRILGRTSGGPSGPAAPPLSGPFGPARTGYFLGSGRKELTPQLRAASAGPSATRGEGSGHASYPVIIRVPSNPLAPPLSSVGEGDGG